MPDHFAIFNQLERDSLSDEVTEAFSPIDDVTTRKRRSRGREEFLLFSQPDDGKIREHN
jgi:hypothetical protein